MADKDKGRWVTIGAVNGKGGSPVFIKDGEITKGAGSVKGKEISAVDKNKKSGSDGAPSEIQKAKDKGFEIESVKSEKIKGRRVKTYSIGGQSISVTTHSPSGKEFSLGRVREVAMREFNRRHEAGLTKKAGSGAAPERGNDASGGGRERGKDRKVKEALVVFKKSKDQSGARSKDAGDPRGKVMERIRKRSKERRQRQRKLARSIVSSLFERLSGEFKVSKEQISETFQRELRNSIERLVRAKMFAATGAAHYAKAKDEGRWVTIGASEVTTTTSRGTKTKKTGGTPVFIKGGVIEKGPKGLTGKAISKGGKISEKKAKKSEAKGKNKKDSDVVFKEMPSPGADSNLRAFVKKEGRRFFLDGAEFSDKNTLKNIGFKWDKDKKRWWTSDKLKAKEAEVKLNPIDPSESIDKDSAVVSGTARYNGREYVVVGEFEDLKKIASKDGARPFWVKGKSLRDEEGFDQNTSINAIWKRRRAERQKEKEEHRKQEETSKASREESKAKQKPSEKQIDFAYSLVSRAARSGAWHDTDAGAVFPPPSRTQIANMSRAGVSALISDMKANLSSGYYSALSRMLPSWLVADRLVKYSADDSKGVWRTIKGAKVFIEGGKITKGPDRLKALSSGKKAPKDTKSKTRDEFKSFLSSHFKNFQHKKPPQAQRVALDRPKDLDQLRFEQARNKALRTLGKLPPREAAKLENRAQRNQGLKERVAAALAREKEARARGIAEEVKNRALERMGKIMSGEKKAAATAPKVPMFRKTAAALARTRALRQPAKAPPTPKPLHVPLFKKTAAALSEMRKRA